VSFLELLDQLAGRVGNRDAADLDGDDVAQKNPNALSL
jgi:hypothetical protein